MREKEWELPSWRSTCYVLGSPWGIYLLWCCHQGLHWTVEGSHAQTGQENYWRPSRVKRKSSHLLPPGPVFFLHLHAAQALYIQMWPLLVCELVRASNQGSIILQERDGCLHLDFLHLGIISCSAFLERILFYLLVCSWWIKWQETIVKFSSMLSSSTAIKWNASWREWSIQK